MIRLDRRILGMNRIRLLRENMELRQIDVSKKTGIDQKTLSNYETGKTNPDSYSLIRLAEFFNVSIDYLVGRTDTSIVTRQDLINKIDNLISDLNDIKKAL